MSESNAQSMRSSNERCSAKFEKRNDAENGTSLATAFRGIRELIVHGKIPPGTGIVEADLAARLKMSRTPVRAALHWLQREGYVIVHHSPGRSRIMVAPLTRQDATELYAIVGHTEGLAGRGLASQAGPKRFAIAKRLTKINDRLFLIAEGRGGEPGEIYELDRDFHNLIVEAGAGARLSKLHAAIVPQSERYWRLYASSAINDLHQSVQGHARIIAALVAGNPDELEKGLQDDRLKGAERLGHVIDLFGELGSW